jgi:hypothetical protein
VCRKQIGNCLKFGLQSRARTQKLCVAGCGRQIYGEEAVESQADCALSFLQLVVVGSNMGMKLFRVTLDGLASQLRNRLHMELQDLATPCPTDHDMDRQCNGKEGEALTMHIPLTPEPT